jgi:hypothetical protein
MKKGLIIAVSVIGLLIISMISIPYLFKGKISQKVKIAANNAVNAKIDFSDVELSLFRSFPQLNVSLKNLSLTGIGEFDKTALLKVELLSTSVNLSTLWRSEGISISSIRLDRPSINLVVNKSGKSNWDITKTATNQQVKPEGKSTSVDLKKIEIRDAILVYNDESTPMLLSLRNGNFDISGALKGSNSQLNIMGKADSINFEYNSSRYVSNLNASLTGGLQSDFEKMSFTLLKNQLLINKLPVEAEGTFTLGELDYNFDLTFKSPTSAFGDLLGFIPDQYQKNMKGVETKGDIAFGGFVKGTYSATTIPAFGIDLKIAGGQLKYPNLPREIEAIEVSANVSKAQGDLDLTLIDIQKFNASIAGNPIAASLYIASPVSDPKLKGNLNGRIDFASLKQAIPMDSVNLAGVIDAAIDFNGQYSSIEKEQYENFNTQGTISLQDFSMESKNLPQRLEIKSANIGLNPKSISLTNLAGNMGESDFNANGSITNYWPYLLKNGILNGTMTLNSGYINFNQLMPDSASKDSTAAGKPFEIPENFNFTVQSSINKALYDKMAITGITGKILVKERKVILEGLNLNMLSGKVLVSGVYSTPKGVSPDFDFKMDIKDFDLPTAYKSLSTIRHFLPIASQSTGAFNTGIVLTGKIGPGYAPLFSTLNGGGLITAKNIELIGANLFKEIGKYFRKDLFNTVKVNDFLANFKMADGGLVVSPFNTKIAGQEVTISGKQSVALNLDYRIDFKVNRDDLSEEVTKYIGFVPGAENISKYPIGINLGGTFEKPEIKVDLSEAKSLVEKEFKKKAGSAIQETIKKFGLDKLFK